MKFPPVPVHSPSPSSIQQTADKVNSLKNKNETPTLDPCLPNFESKVTYGKADLYIYQKIIYVFSRSKNIEELVHSLK